VLNFAVSFSIMYFTPQPSQEVQTMVEEIRYPRGAGEAHDFHL